MNDDASADRREALERPEIRRLIERFEEALLAGENPRIEDAVPADLPERMLILEELLHVEIEFRGKRQEPVALSKYLDRFPQVAADAHAVGRLRETVRRFVPEAQCDDERAVLDVTKSQPAPASEQVPFGRIALQSEFIDSDQPVGGHGRRGADSMATGAAAGTTGSPGRFRILRPHAKGGLGQVSVALDRDLNREVALKEIQPQHADDQTSRERFLVEAEITGGLEHPGIVPVYALGHDPDGRPFYVMRFVKGDSLKQAIEQFHQADNPNRSDPGARQLALRQLLGRFIDVCNAVEYAHSRGVLHRDLKPGNIMVGKYGETLVVDWGLAKTVGSSETASRSEETSLRPLSALSSSGHTQPGSAVGTPAYMSPEQAAGNLDVLGPASDVYSLGATLYHVLTGVPPFERQDVAAVLRKVQTGEIRKPRAVQREIPAALEAICLKAMALAPSDRYATPRLMADDLEHWLADEPVAAAPERIGERLSRIGRRHRGAVRAGAAALILIALVAIVAALLINSARHDALDLASKNENLALEKGQLAEEKGKLAEENAALAREEGEARAAEAEQAALARKRARELRHSLYLSDINRVEQYARIPNVERMRALLARHIPNENEEDLRGFDWSYWWNFIHGDRLCLEGDEPVQKVAASPDGRTIAIACPGGRLHLVDSHTGQRRRLVLTLPAENCAALRFTGDGKQLVAVGAKGAFKAWNAETGQVIRDQHAQSPPEKQAREQCSRWPAAISADGRTILARHPNQEVPVMGKWSGPSCLYLADLSTGLYIGTSVPPGQKSRETDPLAGAMLRFTDRSRMPRQPNLLNVGSALGELPPMATIDPTGSRYWPSAKDASAPPVEEWGAPVFSLALSPSGKWFADGGRDGLVCLWNSETLAPERTLAAHEGIVWDLTFSGDERYLASAGTDGLVVVWDTSSGQPVARCRGSDRPVRSVVFLPGDRRVAAAGDDGVLRIWDARSGRPLRDLYGHTARIHSLAVAADETGHDIRLVSGGADGTVRVWAVDGPPDVLMPRDSSILTNALAPPQARWLAAVDAWGSIHVWDSETGTHRALLTPPLNSLFGSPIPNAVISAADDGSRLAVNYLGSLVVWDVDARKKALQIDGMRIQVPGELPRNVSSLPPNLQFQCIALSRDGKLLAAGCSDGAIRFWNVETREVVRSWSYSSEQNQSGAPIAAIKFLPDQSGMVVVRGGAPSEVRVRRFLDDADRLILASPRIEGIAVSRDGSQIASVGSEGLQVVDIESGSVIARPVDAGDKLRFVDFSPDGRMLVILGTKNDVRLWDLARGAETRRWNADLPIVAAFIDDGRRLALATQKGIIELWQPGDDRPVERLQAPAGPLYSADLSADGQWLAAAVRLRAGPFGRKLQSDTIVLLDIAGGNQSMVAKYFDEARPFVAFLPDDRGLVSNLGVHLWRGQRRSLEGAQWTPLGAFPPNKSGSHPTVPLAAVSGDGSRLAVVDPQAGGIQIWDRTRVGPAGPETFSRSKLLPAATENIFALAFSLTDATVAAADRDVVRLWSVRDEKPIDWQGHGGPVRAVAWSRDGALLASAGSDGTVRLWNPGQRRELALCRGHAGAVNAVALPPDGRTVVSGGDDGAIVVFDIESGEVRTRLAAHQGPVHHLAFGHDGDVLISSGEDGRVRLWRGGTGGERILVALPSAGASDDAPEVRDPAAPSQGDGAPGQKE